MTDLNITSLGWSMMGKTSVSDKSTAFFWRTHDRSDAPAEARQVNYWGTEITQEGNGKAGWARARPLKNQTRGSYGACER